MPRNKSKWGLILNVGWAAALMLAATPARAEGPFVYIRCSVDWQDYSGVWLGNWRQWGASHLVSIYRIGPDSISEYEYLDSGQGAWRPNRCGIDVPAQHQCAFSDRSFVVHETAEDRVGRIVAETSLLIDRRQGTFVEEDDWYPQDEERKGYGECEAIDDPKLDRKF